MPEATVTLMNATGLHARPAKIFARAAASAAADVFVEKDGRRVNAKSVLSVLTLDCHQGDEIPDQRGGGRRRGYARGARRARRVEVRRRRVR